MIDLTPIINAVIGLVVALIGAFLVPILKKNLEEKQFQSLEKWIDIGVAAAELLFVGSGRGEEKKQYVIDFLKDKGFKIDTDEISNMIEAAVLSLKNSVRA